MPVIPLNNIAPWTQAIAYAGQTVFSTNWTSDALTDIVVYSRPAGTEADDSIQTVSPMNYTVAYVGSNAYIQVTFGAPYASLAGDIVTIIRNTPADRMNLYTNTNFTPSMLNGDFNREVMMIQQRVLCDNSLAVKYNNSETLNPNGITDNILPYLPPDCVWMKNTPNTRIIAVLNGSSGSSVAIIIIINQPNHGFLQDQVVYYTGAAYALAKADSAVTAEVVGMVASVLDVNNFALLVIGQDFTNQVLVPGGVYFLSDVTPGLLTLTEPTTPGSISKPLFIAVAADEGYFFNMRGKIIPQPGFAWNSVAVDTVMLTNNGYLTTGGGTLNLTLPAVSALYDTLEIQGYLSTGWKINQLAGQSIIFESIMTTVGTAGYLSSAIAADSIKLMCVVPNLTWKVVYDEGNINYN